MSHWICLILEIYINIFSFSPSYELLPIAPSSPLPPWPGTTTSPPPLSLSSSITQTLWLSTHRKLQCVSLPAPRDNGTHLPHCFRRRCFSFASSSSLLKLTELITCTEDLSTCNKINLNLIYSLFLHTSEIKETFTLTSPSSHSFCSWLPIFTYKRGEGAFLSSECMVSWTSTESQMLSYLEYLSKTIHPFLISNILMKARTHIRHQIISFSHTCKRPTSNVCTEAQLRNLKKQWKFKATFSNR